MPSRASILCGLAAGAAVTLLPHVAALPEAAAIAAPARDVYTRKRVNGRWITGVFTKTATARGRARHRLATRSRVEAPVERPAAPAGATPVRRADTPTTTASIVPATPDAKIERMRPALEAHARELASRTVAAAPPEPAQAALPASPRSVIFDFDKGVKTVVFGDGNVVSEAFDAAEMRALASLRSNSR